MKLIQTFTSILILAAYQIYLLVGYLITRQLPILNVYKIVQCPFTCFPLLYSYTYLGDAYLRIH